MPYIDISLPIHNQTITWPGDQINIVTQPPGEDEVVLSTLSLGTHIGTHIDAPAHFIPGSKTVDQIPLEKYNGSCQVITVKTSAPEITLTDFNTRQIRPRSRLLFKTRNSKLLESGKFSENYTALSTEVAQFLADREIWLVGIDFLSIEKFHSPGHPVHKVLLEKEVVILESLYLEKVTKGNYDLVCLPLSLFRLEAAPCRAVLRNI